MGLSGPSRLHDHCVSLEAMSPGEVRAGGAGLTLEHGVAATPFGPALVGITARGLCCLEFLADGDQGEVLEGLARRWPRATLRPASRALVDSVGQAVSGAAGQGPALPLRCLLYTSPSPRDRTRSRMPSPAPGRRAAPSGPCLLYTSDAADE